MSFYQYLKRHIFLIICLLVIGFGIVGYIELFCPEKIGVPSTKGVNYAFEPIYNKKGSLYHAKLGIGYRQGLLILECLVTLISLVYFYRFVLYYNIFFKIKGDWLYFLDFGSAVIIARLINYLLGRYVLDYIYIRAGHAIYDFFDFCIGICIVGIVLWCIPVGVKYHRYKKENTKGMSLREKFRWEMKLTFDFIKMPFRPIRTWWKSEVDRYD